MSFVLVVRMRVKEGEEENALAVIRELAAESRQEPGNEAYVPCVDPEDPRSILFYEQYADQARSRRTVPASTSSDSRPGGCGICSTGRASGRSTRPSSRTP